MSDGFNDRIPRNVDFMFIDKWIQEWGPALKEKLPSYRGKLLQDNGIPHPHSLRVIDMVDRHFLFHGYMEHFSAMIPREHGVVLGHNDA